MSSKPDSFMPLWIGDYLADTMHLTRDQHGAYLLLLMAYWRHARALPNDNAYLASVTKSTEDEWRMMAPVLAMFFTVDATAWTHRRVEEELKKAKKAYDDKVGKAKAGAAKRWSGHKPKHPSSNAQAMPNQCQSQPHLSFPSEKERVVGTTAQKNSAVVQSTGNNWNEQYPNWTKFRATVGDKIWMAWFDHLTPINETTIACKTPFQANEITLRYGKFLESCFLGDVTFVVSKAEKPGGQAA